MTTGWDLAEPTVLGEGEVSIKHSSFGFDSTYGEQICLILEGQVRTAEGETFDWRKLYSIGKGWDVKDAGATIVAADGRPKKIQPSSKYGIFIDAATQLPDLAKELANRGSCFDAKVWEGLCLEVKATERDYGGDIGKKSTLVPVGYSGGAAIVSASTSTPVASPAASGELSPALKRKLKTLAKEATDWENFIDRAFVEVDGVDKNPYVEGLVADSADFYESLIA